MKRAAVVKSVCEICLAVLVCAPFLFRDRRGLASAPRHCVARIGPTVITDFWVTNGWDLQLKWKTNVAIGRGIYAEAIWVTNRW